jgi:GAF domain-containing protein
MAGEFIFRQAGDLRWKLLAAAQDRLARAQSLDQIVGIVRSTARAICSSDGVCFVMREGDQCHYIDEDAIGALWKGQKFPMASCVSGWAMLNGRTVAIEDVFADPRIPHETYRKTFVKSMIVAPVGRNTAVGAIGAYWREFRAFSEREVAVIVALAASVESAMKGSRAA